MSGSQIGTVVGGVIGAYFGNWQLGAAIGGYIGGVIDPTVIKGPSIGDAQQQSSMAGMPIPKVYGHSPPIAPTCIDGDKIARKITKTEDVGKGATQQTKTEHFIATRAFLVCEGEISGFARITRNGKLVYSTVPGDSFEADSAAFASQITIYTGSETQGPDPSLEALHGVGNTPYYRGRAYFVVRDDEEIGGAMNQYRVEVMACGEVTVTPAFSIASLGPAFYYQLTEGGSALPDTFGNLPDMIPHGDYIADGGGLTFTSLNGDANTGLTGMATLESPNNVFTIMVRFRVNSVADVPASMRLIAGHFNNTLFEYYHWAIFLGGPNKLTPTVGAGNAGGAGVIAQAGYEVGLGSDHVIVLQADGTNLKLLDGNGNTLDSVAYTGTLSGSADLMMGGHELTSYGGQITSSHLLGVPQAINSTQIKTVSAEFGVLPDGIYVVPDALGLYVNADGALLSTAASTTIAECAAVWKDVVSDIANRASTLLPAVLDIDNMTDEVPGFVLGNPSLSGTDYVRTLCLYYFVDMPEYDQQVHAIRRGGPVVATFTEDDLLAVESEDDNERAPALDGFKRLTVMYPDPANKYIATPQTSPRTSPDITTSNAVTLECPIPFDADTMAKKADILQKIAFLQVEGGFKRAFPAEFSQYVPSDPIVFNNRRHIIIKASNDDSMVRFECQYDRVSAYSSLATPSVAPTPSPQTSNLKGPTLFMAMNLPRLRSQDSTPGAYLALAGILPGWPGGLVDLSTDEGVSYTTVLSSTAGSLMGDLTAAITDSSEPLSVHAFGGQLESKTTAQVASGGNSLAVVTGGVAEILNFEDAAESPTNYYDLTTLTRGLKGTVPAAHAIGDKFADLSLVFFLPLDISLAGKTLYFRAYASGTSPDSAPVVPFVFTPQFTGPEVVEFEQLSTGAYATTETGAYFEVVSA